MKILLDTSVLVAAMVEQHGDHDRAFALLERVQDGQDEGYVSAHSLAETYATLTQLPAPFRHTPEQALLSIQENILKYFKATSLTGTDYASLIKEAAAAGIQGGTIYDAVILKSADKSAVDKIFTLNIRHFQAVASSDLATMLSAP